MAHRRYRLLHFKNAGADATAPHSMLSHNTYGQQRQRSLFSHTPSARNFAFINRAFDLRLVQTIRWLNVDFDWIVDVQCPGVRDPNRRWAIDRPSWISAKEKRPNWQRAEGNNRREINPPGFFQIQASRFTLSPHCLSGREASVV